MTRIILIFMCCLFSVQSASAAKVTVEDARRKLRQWGVSYCIRQYSDNYSAKVLGAVAQGGYFELGFHDDEEAYRGVRKFVQTTMEQNKVSKGQQPNTLTQCIDMYESQKFEKIIRRMDKYFDPKEYDSVDDAWIRL